MNYHNVTQPLVTQPPVTPPVLCALHPTPRQHPCYPPTMSNLFHPSPSPMSFGFSPYSYPMANAAMHPYYSQPHFTQPPVPPPGSPPPTMPHSFRTCTWHWLLTLPLPHVRAVVAVNSSRIQSKDQLHPLILARLSILCVRRTLTLSPQP